ncbi:unnamed protein product, partial [Rotaria sp. Silwood1]
DNEEVKDSVEEDQKNRQQLYQDLDVEMNDDQNSTADESQANNADDNEEQHVSSTIDVPPVTTAVIGKHRRVDHVYMLRTSPYGLRKRKGE